MRNFFHNPTSWLAVFCALLSAGLWAWTRRLPETTWESSVAVSPSPSAAETVRTTGTEPMPPATTDADETAPASTPAPPLAEATPPQPTPEPTPVAATVAAASPTPSPTPTPPAAKPPEADLAGPLPANPGNAAPPSSPQPTAQPTPAAAILPPAPLDLSEIAQQPELWPRQIVLLASVRFPVILNGVNVGNVQVPPGSAVLLRKVGADGTVEIERQGSRTKVQATSTDLLARAQALAAAHKAATPAP